MKYQPMEMKMVLTRLQVAFRAGRSEVEITLKRLNRSIKMSFRTKSRLQRSRRRRGRPGFQSRVTSSQQRQRSRKVMRVGHEFMEYQKPFTVGYAAKVYVKEVPFEPYAWP